MEQVKSHILGDAVSKAPHVINSKGMDKTSVNDVEFLPTDIDGVLSNYDYCFEPIVRALYGNWPSDETKKL